MYADYHHTQNKNSEQSEIKTYRI